MSQVLNKGTLKAAHALMKACNPASKTSVATVRKLIAKFSVTEVLNFQDEERRSPLLLCAEYGLDAVAAVLLQAGANVDIENETCGSALFVAAFNRQVAVARVLVVVTFVGVVVVMAVLAATIVQVMVAAAAEAEAATAVAVVAVAAGTAVAMAVAVVVTVNVVQTPTRLSLPT